MLDKDRVTELVMQSGLHEYSYGHNQERFMTALAYFATALQHEVLKAYKVRTEANEPAKVCPECNSDDVGVIKQTENGEVVCAADHCNWCGHQWNVG